MSLTSSVDYTEAPRTRTRTRKPTFKIEMPKAEKGKFFVALRRGISYHLASIDRTFKRGEVKEVSEEVYLHLSTNAYDIVSHEDADCGRVRRKVRKFSFSPELPEELEVSYPE